MMGTKCNVTSAYHPQSNGQDERFNQTLQRQLLKYVDEKQNTWDLYIESVLFSYRVSVQDSTKQIPFYLVYGRQARLPVDLQVKSIKNDFENKPTIDDSLKDRESLLENVIEMRKNALQNIQKAQECQKKAYDVKHCSENQLFKVGIQVLIRNSKKLSRKGSKMEPNWTGPYKICQILKKNTFRLCYVNDCNKKLKQVYNMTRLKIYYPISENMVLNNIVEKVLNNSEEKSKLSIFTLTMKKLY